MLKLSLTPLIRAKGFMHSQSFLRQHGFTNREARTLMSSTGIRLMKDSTVQRLCEALVCNPNDLFMWTGGKEHICAGLNVEVSASLSLMLHGKTEREVELLTEKWQQGIGEEVFVNVQAEGRLFLNVRRLVELRQQPYPQRYLKLNGFSRMEANKLLDAKRLSVRLDMLTRLCTFFQCLPNDLYDWDGAEAHFLNGLKKVPAVNLSKVLSQLPPKVVTRVLGKG